MITYTHISLVSKTIPGLKYGFVRKEISTKHLHEFGINMYDILNTRTKQPLSMDLQ